MNLAESVTGETNLHRPGDIVGRGKAIYERDLRPRLDIDENVGKILLINVDSGEYLMGEDVNGDDDLELDLQAVKRFPGRVLFGMRIGYPAFDAAGGALVPLPRPKSIP